MQKVSHIFVVKNAFVLTLAPRLQDLPPDVKPLLRDPRQTARTGGNSQVNLNEVPITNPADASGGGAPSPAGGGTLEPTAGHSSS